MKKLFVIIASLTGAAAALLYGGQALANPLFFPVTVQTASATGTPAYMTAGTATSTLTWDSYNAVGSYTGTLSAALMIQLAASSTATTLRTNIEYSQDGIDWYQTNGLFTPGYSTTTPVIDIGQVSQYSLTFASTTPGLGAVSTTTATTTRALPVRVPTRYVRAVFSLPAGSTPGAVWAQFVPIKERAESK